MAYNPVDADWPGGQSGEYIYFGGTQSNINVGEAVLLCSPYKAPRPIAISHIGLNVGVAGSAGSVIRIGAYNDSNGIPGSLIFDAGTVDSTSTGFKEITTSQTLPVGRFWLAAAVQGVAATAAQISGITANLSWNNNAMLMAAGGGTDACYFTMKQSSVSGALPNPAFASRSDAGNGIWNVAHAFRVKLA